MSGKKNIVSIAQLGLAWGLKEIRALLSSRSELKQDVKVVFMKLEGLQRTTANRITCSLASKINPNATFTNKDSLTKKLDEIFEDFNIEPEYQGGIFVACNGKGEINRQLQNNSVGFLAAEKIASNVELGDSNYVVYVDTDVRQLLLKTLPAEPGIESEVIEVTHLDRLENQIPSQRDPNERFTLLLASSKKLRSVINHFASVEESKAKEGYLSQIEKLLDSHLISLTRAEESYRQLKDDQMVEKEALEKKLQQTQTNRDKLVSEMEEREKEHNEEMAEKDDKQAELQTELERLQDIKTEKFNNQTEIEAHQAEIQKFEKNISDLQNEISDLNEDFRAQKEQHQLSIQDLEDEKDELATDLEKKTRALKRLENLHERVNLEATNVQNQLEENDFTPGKMVQRRVTSEIAAPPTIQLNKKHKSKSLMKPTGFSLEEETVVNQLEGDSTQFYVPRNETPSGVTTTPIRTPVRTPSRPVICKPANFGLNTWNPLTTDIYVHLDKALKAGREALNVGATHTSVTRMILNSLGSNCDHVENFIEGADQMSLEKFSEAIGKILGKKSSVQMQSFLTAQRRSGEDLLAYFTRLQMLYRSSNKLTENSGWEEDPTHAMSFYSKIYDACYQAQKTELIRKTEELLEKGNLTLPKLKGILIDVNKIDTSKLSAEEPVVAYVNDKSTYKSQKFAQKKKAWYEDDTSKSNQEKNNDVKKYDNKTKIVCWYCGQPGHKKPQCYKLIRKLREEENKGRETKTRGSRPQENNTQH